MIKQLLAWPIALVVAAPAATGQPTIERVAPADSVLVAGVPSVQEAKARFERTRLWALWQSEPIKAMWSDALEKGKKRVNELFQELELGEGESLPIPLGPVGVALFPVTDDEVQETHSGFLVMADFAGNADRAGKLVDALIAKARNEDDLEVDEEKVMGRTVYTFDLTRFEAVDLEDLDLEELAPDMLPMPDVNEVVQEVAEVHLCRDGSRYLFASDRQPLVDALEVIDGGEPTGYQELESYQAVRRQLGEVDAWAVVRIDAMLNAMGGGDPMAAMMGGMVTSIIGDVSAVGMGVRFDAPSAMVEKTLCLHMPNGKSGLLGLLDVPSPRRDIPGFAGADSVSFYSFNFNFGGVMEFLRAAGRDNPMVQMQIDPFLEQQGATIEKICAALGPRIHGVMKLSRPLKLESQRWLMAIRSEKPADVEQVFAQYAPGMGFKPREFLGNRIYSMEFNPFAMAGGAPGMEGGGDGAADGMSVGFGGGYVTIGTTSMVEDALRSGASSGGGRSRGGGLGDDPGFARAMKALPEQGVVAWGVASIVDYLEYMRDLGPLKHAQIIDEARAMDPEMAKEMEAELAKSRETPWAKLDMKHLRRFIGPVSWAARSTEDGYVLKGYLLGAEEK